MEKRAMDGLLPGYHGALQTLPVSYHLMWKPQDVQPIL